MLYDILIFNNSTKKDYLFQSQLDISNNGLYHIFEDLDLSALPGGEYTVFTIRNDYGEDVKWQVSDVPLNSILTYDGNSYKLSVLNPEISLMKIGTENTKDNSSYKKKDVEYYYRRKD